LLEKHALLTSSSPFLANIINTSVMFNRIGTDLGGIKINTNILYKRTSRLIKSFKLNYQDEVALTFKWRYEG
jgi:hypothetical protein